MVIFCCIKKLKVSNVGQLFKNIPIAKFHNFSTFSLYFEKTSRPEMHFWINNGKDVGGGGRNKKKKELQSHASIMQLYNYAADIKVSRSLRKCSEVIP